MERILQGLTTEPQRTQAKTNFAAAQLREAGT
jgi:hypothetical protein